MFFNVAVGHACTLLTPLAALHVSPSSPPILVCIVLTFLAPMPCPPRPLRLGQGALPLLTLWAAEGRCFGFRQVSPFKHPRNRVRYNPSWGLVGRGVLQFPQFACCPRRRKSELQMQIQGTSPDSILQGLRIGPAGSATPTSRQSISKPLCRR